MRKAIPLILTAMLLFGVFFCGSAEADDPPVEQVVFYVQ